MTLPAKWYIPCVVAFAIGIFAVGRYTAPKPEIKTVTVEHVVTMTKEVKAEQKDTTTAKTVVVYRDRVVHKDGTVETKTESHTTSGTETKAQSTDTTAAASTTDVHQSTTVTTQKPNWHVTVMAGTPISLRPSILVGASVERRILGPVYVGVWALQNVNGGNPLGGVSVGVRF